ncbi:cell wall hydrolase [Pseudoxanthomonas kalamensis DSM 18571]|uniref:N-acetylmuramoyl-L-alanine amidase n=1 Tax=Pseudoxanthomonas kalamensis TaxID=289483 RepID=UPI0013908F36|nr:N-acetylmuramoyl-L-alanine amidase [Pseudoxanthomonas kalamensis]KAF1712135.1 cell wall hydrolase [Pseudoxanthomonas kalamensis DSM 18571]
MKAPLARLRPALALLATLVLAACGHDVRETVSPLSGHVICLDPGHGGTADSDHYRQGPGGEREEWINLRVARLLQTKLQQAGARVVMTRTEDVFVPLDERARIARDGGAELFLSIHHNAAADPQANFPIVYFHGNASENLAGVALGRALVDALRGNGFHAADTPGDVISDFAIFADAGAAVLRGSYGIPGVIAEASFFSNADEEARLKTPGHNQREADAHFAALEKMFSAPLPPVYPKQSRTPSPPPFRGLQEAERMDGAALRWRSDYEQAVQLEREQPDTAYALFTESARGFPDSPLAGRSHQHRAELLRRAGKSEQAEQERLRVREHYPLTPTWP